MPKITVLGGPSHEGVLATLPDEERLGAPLPDVECDVDDGLGDYYAGLSLVELRDILKAKGLSPYGNKPVLAARLRAAEIDAAATE